MNAYEQQYGSYADSVASKYGLDTGVFRRLIESESSWNPTAVNPKAVGNEFASGIAQFLPSTAASRGVDPFNPYSALDGAAKYLSELQSQYGLAGGIAKYKGYSDSNMTNGLQVASAIMGGSAATKAAQDASGKILSAATNPKIPENTTPLWKYSFADLKNAIKNGALSTTIGFLGLLIIALSVWAIFTKGQSIKMIAGNAAKAV